MKSLAVSVIALIVISLSLGAGLEATDESTCEDQTMITDVMWMALTPFLSDEFAEPLEQIEGESRHPPLNRNTID